MKYFLDTEFIEDGSTIDLISIGIVAEDSRSLYRQNLSCNFTKASDWVWRNVFPHLVHFDMRGRRSCDPHRRDCGMMDRPRPDSDPCSAPDCPWRPHYGIRDDVREFLNPEKYGKPEIWGYYAAYDWVVFCQLFGPMIALPKGYPVFCRDVKQLCVEVGDPRLPANSSTEHHALSDALWIRGAYQFLTTPQRGNIYSAGQYRAAYMEFLDAKKTFPNLNHTGHEPQTFGLPDYLAEQIRAECEREVNRTT